MVVQPGGDLPAARGQSSMVVMGEKLYVFGGRSFNRSFNDLWRFNLITREWKEISPEKGDRPMPRHGAAIAALGSASESPLGTLIMSFGRECVAAHTKPRDAPLGSRLSSAVCSHGACVGQD